MTIWNKTNVIDMKGRNLNSDVKYQSDKCLFALCLSDTNGVGDNKLEKCMFYIFEMKHCIQYHNYTSAFPY